MKKFYLAGLCACALFVACEDDNNKNEDVKILNGDYTPKSEAVILCEGSYNQNNSCISFLKDGIIDKNIFSTANGKPLGDTGQDILHTNGAFYVSVSTSAYIVKLNEKTYKEEARYTCSKAESQPRYLAEQGNYLYVSTYAGLVLKLDKNDLSKVAQVAVGSYPEQIAIVGNYLLCCNSGYGSGNTISAIQLNNFKVEKEVKVRTNPTRIVSGSNNKAYFLTTAYTADWSSAVGTISSIDVKNGFQVDSVAEATNMAVYDDDLYLCNCTPNYTTYTYQTSFSKYDMKDNKMDKDPIFANDTIAHQLADKCIYLFDVNPKNGEIFVGTSDYYTNSPIYVTDKKGQSWCKLPDAGGVNASRIAF